MVSSAATLISSHGVSATSFSEVLAHSGAPRGSIYHHFPLGKQQLAAEAIRTTSARVLAYQSAVEPATAEEVLERFIGMWRAVVQNSHGTAGCVVAGVAIDTSRLDANTDGADTESGAAGLLDAVRATFQEWMDLLAEQLRACDLPHARAAAIATTTLAAMEGALILCRAEGGVGPLDTVAAELLRLLT
ncbi:TetR family transcriptional regulator [Jatrophihabitans sp. GAS493]|uniref:TetR/AcrR family transcriptional regulator n=1 Tax=Jatrophihabitans sp. GAS493 TaxID=1907575 RepID=UPI000BB75935|nr:TetR/AcrR family transcriptional regulator [Jatrophihabitans sp. GAS493]SOD72267.1 TetR family transcriptional regulator [Jatrophihabitans sp. GAS493]